MRIYKLVGIVLSALLLLVSCTNSDVDKKKVKIAYANWLEGIAMSHWLRWYWKNKVTKSNCKTQTLLRFSYLCQERNQMSFWMLGCR